MVNRSPFLNLNLKQQLTHVFKVEEVNLINAANSLIYNSQLKLKPHNWRFMNCIEFMDYLTDFSWFTTLEVSSFCLFACFLFVSCCFFFLFVIFNFQTTHTSLGPNISTALSPPFLRELHYDIWGCPASTIHKNSRFVMVNTRWSSFSRNWNWTSEKKIITWSHVFLSSCAKL